MKGRDLYNLPFMKEIKAWFISIGSAAIGVTVFTITGFSILYKDEITAQTVVISVLIALASLALSVLTGIIADIISGKVRKRTKK